MSNKVDDLLGRFERLHAIEVDRAVHRLGVNQYPDINVGIGQVQAVLLDQIKIELQTKVAIQ